MPRYSETQQRLIKLVRWVEGRVEHSVTSHNHGQVMAAIRAIKPNLTANSYTPWGIRRHIANHLSHYEAILQSISNTRFHKLKRELSTYIYPDQHAY